MKMIMSCEHIHHSSDEQEKLGRAFFNPEHDGRDFVIQEICDLCMIKALSETGVPDKLESLTDQEWPMIARLPAEPTAWVEMTLKVQVAVPKDISNLEKLAAATTAFVPKGTSPDNCLLLGYQIRDDQVVLKDRE